MWGVGDMQPTEAEITALFRASNPESGPIMVRRSECRRTLEQLYLAGWMMARIEDRLSLAEAAERLVERADQ